MTLALSGGGNYGYHKTSVRVSGSNAILNLLGDGTSTPSAIYNEVGG